MVRMITRYFSRCFITGAISRKFVFLENECQMDLSAMDDFAALRVRRAETRLTLTGHCRNLEARSLETIS